MLMWETESNVSSRGTWPGNAEHLWDCPVWPHLLRFIHRETAQLEAQEVALAGSRRDILRLDGIFLSLWLVVTSGSMEQYSGYVCEWMDEYTPCMCFFLKYLLVLAALGLRSCCVSLWLQWAGSCSLVVACGLLVAMTSLVAVHRL